LGISAYEDTLDTLFCSMIRDPVERAASLFSYYTDIDAASDSAGEKLRRELTGHWRSLGMDPTSLVRSLEKCPDFRRQVADHQCAYLSTRGQTFDGVRNTLSARNVVLGTMEQHEAFITLFSDQYRWPRLNMPIANASKRESIESILREPGAVELVESLCAEDRKLFDFVRTHGLFVDLKTPGHLKLGLTPTATSQWAQAAQDSELWEKVKLSAPTEWDPLTCEGRVVVTVHNGSPHPIDHLQGKGIFASYRLLATDGTVLDHEAPWTRLPDSVLPDESISFPLSIDLQRPGSEGAAALRVTLLERGSRWLDKRYTEHTALIKLDRG
jgi:hypothetical protein